MKKSYVSGFIFIMALFLLAENVVGSEAQALSGYPSWEVGATYTAGQLVSYQNGLYRCRQSHTVWAPNWTPPNTPALWSFVRWLNTARRPFPYNKSKQTVRGVTVSQMNRDVEIFYQEWKKKYIKSIGNGKYIVRAESTPPIPSETNSEAMGYGMIITALMGKAEDKLIFDGLWKMCDEHRSVNSKLIDWSLGGEPRPDWRSSATDGDLDITYGLCLAAYQWGTHNSGRCYMELARELVTEIDKMLIYDGGAYAGDFRLALGDWVLGLDENHKYKYGTRISDWMPNHLNLFNAYINSTKLQKARDNIHVMAKHLQDTHSANHGFLPDFAVGKKVRLTPAPPNYMESAFDGHFYENACRFPMRMVAAYKHEYWHKDKYLAILKKFVAGVEKVVSTSNIWDLRSGYFLYGTPCVSYSYGKSYGGPLLAAAIAVGNSKFANSASWKWLATFGNNSWDNYYHDTIALLSMLLISDNWWEDFPE